MSMPSEIIPCPQCGGEIEASGRGIGVELICPLCGQPFLFHIRFAHYLLEKRVGSGGMAVVYLAQDETTHQQVAVKVLNRKLSDDPRFVRDFENETRVTASLNHPNIVQVHETGSWEGQEYLVMEYLPGGSLDDRITANRLLTEAEALEIGSAVIAALRLAASHGLIHRDIKPGNILRGPDGTPKLVDFGLCLAIAAQQEESPVVWGTASYIPPERLDREPEDVRSDIYGLGATLFHGLAGRPPYLERDPLKIADCHRAGPPARLREVAPGISEATAALIDRAIQTRPDDRFATYEEMLEEIEKARKNLNTTPATISEKTKAAGDQDLRSGPWPFWKQAVVFLLFAGATAALTLCFFWKAVFPQGFP